MLFHVLKNPQISFKLTPLGGRASKSQIFRSLSYIDKISEQLFLGAWISYKSIFPKMDNPAPSGFYLKKKVVANWPKG